MSEYAEALDDSLGRVLRYASKKYNDAGAAPLLRFLFEKHRQGVDSKQFLPIGLYGWAEDHHWPLAEHFHRAEPLPIHTYDFAGTQRGPGRRYGSFHPLAMEDALLVGALHAGSEKHYNGAHLMVMGIDPDSKGKSLTKPTLTNYHRFLPYHWTAHYDRVPLQKFLDQLPGGSALRQPLHEYMQRHSLVPDKIHEGYDTTNWSDVDWHRAIHTNWPKDEYSHAYQQWLDSHGESSLAEAVHEPNRYRYITHLPRSGPMENEFVHRGVHIGVNRYPTDWNGDPNIHVTTTVFHPDHDRSQVAYGNNYGRPGPQHNHIDFTKRFSGPQAQLWAQGFPEGEPREKAVAAVKNAIEHPKDW